MTVTSLDLSIRYSATLAAAGTRTTRNVSALLLAVGGVYLLTHVRIAGEPVGIAFAFANAALFALYIVLAHRVARHRGVSGIDGLAASMLVASIVVTPLGGWQVIPVALDGTIVPLAAKNKLAEAGDTELAH